MVATLPDAILEAARASLQAARRRYAQRYVAAVLLPLLAALGLGLALAKHWPAGWPLLLLLAVGSLLVAGWRLAPLRHWHETAAAACLNRLYPALQDSTGLLLADPSTLALLPRLQQRRVAEQLAALAATGATKLLPFSLRNSVAISGLLGAAALGLGWYPAASGPASAPTLTVRWQPSPARPAGPALGVARLEQVRVFVTPPAYTRRPAFAAAEASFSCPAGSRVRWQVRVSQPGGAPPVLELEGRRIPLGPVPGQARTYTTDQLLTVSTLYRLRLAAQVSDDYAIEVRPDQPPTVRLQSPRAYTLIAAQRPRPEVPLRTTLHDDYGLRQAELVLTIATGQGEAVKFRQVRRNLSAALRSQPSQATLTQLLPLPTLGMHPGDELYLYVQALDNHGQRARSDTYLVQWQDTAAAASALALGVGVNTAPAYFRSQRQLIIDTEKLLAERPKLSAAEFASRANALGLDQQALRLRYGKFLGEEAEKALGPAPSLPTADEPALPTAEIEPDAAPLAPEPDDHDDHDHTHVGTRPNDSPTAATDALQNAYAHQHDDAETADFLEPAIKTKLHAVLDEMWAAELRLRTNQPAAARPYEYRALRLLKEVQQQTRAYVRKAGFTPPPLPEANLRLTGELAGATAPHTQTSVPAPAAQPAIRAALRWLAATRAGQPPHPTA